MFRIAKRNRYLRAFGNAGATTPRTPASLKGIGCRESSVFRRLVGRGLIVVVVGLAIGWLVNR